MFFYLQKVGAGASGISVPIRKLLIEVLKAEGRRGWALQLMDLSIDGTHTHIIYIYIIYIHICRPHICEINTYTHNYVHITCVYNVMCICI